MSEMEFRKNVCGHTIIIEQADNRLTSVRQSAIE